MNLIFLTQVYPPDAAAVGQHFEDAAVRLAERGNEVTVYTSDRDYDNPSIKYDSNSRHSGVQIVRLPWTSFGKKTIGHRLLGQASYLGQVFLRLLFKQGVDGVVLTTIPATTGVMYSLLHAIRRFPTLFWVMDLNPDQAVALGIVQEQNLGVRLLRWFNRHLLAGADHIVVLDRYMDNKVQKLATSNPKLEIIPPWPLESHLKPIESDNNTFVKEYGLGKKRVFMYSGNHSLVHPLDTIIEAVGQFLNYSEVEFMFIGGGRAKEGVDDFIVKHNPQNVMSLPYQPLETLSHSLSAADVHFVVMGNEMVGIVHPCKIYGAMAVGRPVVFVGPRESHLGELVEQGGFGWIIDHGDVDGLSRLIGEIAEMPREELEAMGAKGRQLLKEQYSADKLAGEFCRLVETLGTNNKVG
ncbi:MAG: glycosyltransferase family 4 protein [Puniceicoccaceae bacterium]